MSAIVRSCVVAFALSAAAPTLLAQGGTEGGPILGQRAYLKASNPGEDDAFGETVAVWEHTLVVAAIREDSASTGIDGDQEFEGALDSGAVYVFENTPEGLAQQAYLKSHNSNFMDRFGTALALHGDTLVVGAPSEDSSATGVDGNGLDNNSPGSGAAYVFVRVDGAWSQQAYLKPSNTGDDDRFGSAVALWGDTLVVGARREDSSAVGVGGDQTDDGAENSGAVYVFERVGDTWAQTAYLKASNTGAGDGFGGALALHHDTLAVGAPTEDGGATGIDANQLDDSASNAGAVYVFTRDGGAWSQQTYVKPQFIGAHDGFGRALALNDTTLVVGMPGDDAFSAQNPAGSAFGDSGAACVFARDGATWSQQAFLKSSLVEDDAAFGTAVSLGGPLLVVGSPYASNPTAHGGLAQVFRKQGELWNYVHTLYPSTRGAGDRFGIAVALSPFAALVGAHGEDSEASGVDGDQNSNGVSGSGSAWYFVDPLVEHWFDEGSSHPGASGAPWLVGSGPREPGSDNAVRVSGAAASATSAMFVAASSTPVGFKGGTLLPFPFLPPKFVLTSPKGSFYLPFVMPGSAPPGLELWVQWAVVDAGASHGVALSNAVLGVVP